MASVLRCVTIILSSFCVVCVFSCGAPGGESRTGEETPATDGVHSITEWILACRSGNDGFGCWPGDTAFTSRTGMALEALSDLGELENLEAKKELVAWIKARQQPDGGFLEADDFYNGQKLPWDSQSALDPTYWAVRALELLGAKRPKLWLNLSLRACPETAATTPGSMLSEGLRRGCTLLSGQWER